MRHRLFIALVTLVAVGSNAHAQEIKNAHSILGGALTRAGNTGLAQLSDAELSGLCEQGYTSAYFLYTGATARTIRCSRGSIRYQSLSTNNVTPILQDVYRDLQSGGRTFVHCYNGAHASGIVAAIALRQFCGYSGNQAFAYWMSNLGPYPLPASNTNSVGRKIEGFQVIPSLELTSAQQTQFCN